MTSASTLRKWMESESDILFDIQMLRALLNAQALVATSSSTTRVTVVGAMHMTERERATIKYERIETKLAKRERDLEKMRLRKLGIDPKRITDTKPV